jgi:hypothetical protein
MCRPPYLGSLSVNPVPIVPAARVVVSPVFVNIVAASRFAGSVKYIAPARLIQVAATYPVEVLLAPISHRVLGDFEFNFDLLFRAKSGQGRRQALLRKDHQLESEPKDGDDLSKRTECRATRAINAQQETRIKLRQTKYLRTYGAQLVPVIDVVLARYDSVALNQN